MLRIVVFVVLASVVLGQERCCSPETWEGHMGEIKGAWWHGGPSARVSDTHIHFDYATRRWSIHSWGNTTWDGAYDVKNIFDYRNKREWMIDFTARKCSHHSLTTEMYRDCIGSEYEYGGPLYFGGGRGRLYGTLWTRREEKKYIAETRTREGCVLVTVNVMEYNDEQNAFIDTYNIVDVTPGIQDPYAFTPPSFCQQAGNQDNQLFQKAEKLRELNFAKSLFTT